MKKVKVLIFRPHPSESGGVGYYNSLVEKYFISDRVILNYYYTGKKFGKCSYSSRFIKFCFDLKNILFILPNYHLIILNPSLDPKGIIRDGIFHFIIKYFYNKSTLVFFHGWKLETENLIDRHFKKLFKFIFNFDKACVLGINIKTKLVQWGFKPKTIIIETTAFESYKRTSQKDPYKIIFISRLVKKKGCLEALKTIEIVRNEIQNIKLFMVGNGEMEELLKQYVRDRDLKNNVTFKGYLQGKDKYELLDSCGIMLFPTYTEGMPISLLEGMGMGVVVITRPVGGIPDIFEDGKNGFLIKSLDPHDFADKLFFLIKNPADMQNMSINNSNEAMKKFEIKKVVTRLEKIYYETALNGSNRKGCIPS